MQIVPPDAAPKRDARHSTRNHVVAHLRDDEQDGRGPVAETQSRTQRGIRPSIAAIDIDMATAARYHDSAKWSTTG